jgi:hypothetical protein
MTKVGKIAVIVMGLVLAGATAFAANPTVYAADAGILCQVQNGFTGTLSIVVSGAGAAGSIQTNVITCDGLATTLVVTNGGTTAAQLEARIAACTNAAGQALLSVNAEPSLAADTICEVAGTYTAVYNKTLSLLWDVSACLHYDVYLPSRLYNAGVGAYRLAAIKGQPTGTGNVTLSVYQNGTLVDQEVIISPYYVNPATLLNGGTNLTTNTLAAVDIVNLNQSEGITFMGSQPIIIRAARATTATTGFLSAVIESANK